MAFRAEDVPLALELPDWDLIMPYALAVCPQPPPDVTVRDMVRWWLGLLAGRAGCSIRSFSHRIDREVEDLPTTDGICESWTGVEGEEVPEMG